MNLHSLKPAVLGLLLIWQSGFPPARQPASRFQYQRAVTLANGPSSSAAPRGEAAQVCAVLDAEVFAHAAPSLKDLRLYSGTGEIAYATTLNEPVEQESEDARIVNLRGKSGHIFFDMEMPRRAYTGIALDLAARDYVAKATVSGSAVASGGKVTPLGSFTLFDLSSQRLGRSTEIALPESTFRYLHLDLALSPAPGGAAAPAALEMPALVRGATVPPGREAQSIYTTAQRQTSLAHEGQESVATFQVPARVPVERVAFTLAPGYEGSFSRAVRIEARAMRDPASPASDTASEDGSAFRPEEVTGAILRVHQSDLRAGREGREVSAERLSIPLSIGSNMQQPAMVKVMVEDAGQPPLPIASVELQMRQRRICFDARSAAAPLTLSYGDPALEAPAYNDAALSQAAANPRLALLGPERVNAEAVSERPTRRGSRARPVLRWVALLACVCVFALIVIRRSHRQRPM